MASLGTKDNNSIIKEQNVMVASTNSITQKPESTRKSKDRDERLRQIKDRQNEERQRKLEELKAQALAAQKYREQKEEERKRRIEEMRIRENDKRQQVEDRKKAIMDAERDRREYILRKNQERDARLDTKRRNERSSISFAFGSSTPRLLDPVEISLVAPSGSYWGHRRSTSISNVSYGGNATQLSRRSSERELSDGAKKRATSAGGLDRPDGSRSGEVTPGGSSRSGSAMSTSTNASGVVRRTTTTRKPRPASIAGTGMSLSIDNADAFKPHKKDKPPSRPSSTVRRSSSTTSTNGTLATNAPKSSAVSIETPKRTEKRAPIKKAPTPRTATTPKLASPQTETPQVPTHAQPLEKVVTEKTTVETIEKAKQVNDSNIGELITIESTTTQHNSEEQPQVITESVTVVETSEIKLEQDFAPNGDGQNVESSKLNEAENNEMTASMIQRRIRSEEEAKAALAERRRLARVEAERQADLERQRLEEERQQQLKLQAEEEERQRQFEQEAIRLVEEQRLAEELRLQQAIEEACKREEEERLRKEAEEKQRQEREEQEKKAREEAERQKIEVAERLKKEEKEREERRKRVEAIMLRTRAKTSANNTPNKAEDVATNNEINKVSSQQTTEESNDKSANNTNNSVDDSNRKLIGDYEKSVTDKENALIHTFSNLIENNTTQESPQHTVHHAENNGLQNNIKTNGKLLDFGDHSSDIVKTPISNGNGHPLINNLDNKIDSDVNLANQLLDLSLDTNQTADHTVNFNNNSLITSAPLVTSDSHEAKEISLL